MKRDLTRVSVTQRTKHMSVFFVIISRQPAICHDEWRRNAPINKTTASVSVPFLFFPPLCSPLSFFLFSLQPDFAVSIAHGSLSAVRRGDTLQSYVTSTRLPLTSIPDWVSSFALPTVIGEQKRLVSRITTQENPIFAWCTCRPFYAS